MTIEFLLVLKPDRKQYYIILKAIQMKNQQKNRNQQRSPSPKRNIIKVVTVGDASVGKSSVIRRYTDNIFNDRLQATVCIDTRQKNNIEVDGKNVSLIIWDTAGQQSFRTISRSYYKGSNGVIIVYDITKRQSFDNLTYWLSEIQSYAKQNIKIMLVGNKCDLYQKRKVSYQQGYIFAKKNGIDFIEVSAKSSSNIYYAFQTLIKKILISTAPNNKLKNNRQQQNLRLQKNNSIKFLGTSWIDCLKWLNWLV